MNNVEINGTAVQENTVPVRVSRDTRAKIEKELARINGAKEHGRPIRPDAYIALAITLVRPEHIEKLKEASLTNRDRIEQAFRNYTKANGEMSKDDFLGLLLSGAVQPKHSIDLTQSESRS